MSRRFLRSESAGANRRPGDPATADAESADEDGQRSLLEASARTWAERTCAEQGLPAKVRDHGTVRFVAGLLREVDGAKGRPDE